MSELGLALREARLHKNFTQKAIGSMGFCSGKLISAIERGERTINVDILTKVADELDDPRLYLEAANEITGGVFSVPWLNGDSIDLHRTSIKEKVIEELSEAIRAINSVKTYDNPKVCKPEQKELARKSVLESIDAYIGIAHYIIIICNEYELSVKELFTEQREKLIKNKYLKR
jgi:transcriptional regulator with XRE-family HTH domain